MDLFSPPKGPYGYKCPDCDHVWDATQANPTPQDVHLALIRARDGVNPVHCPQCGVLGKTCVITSERYEELKAEREMQASGGVAA